MVKKPHLSDAELLSFALRDVKPLPGRVIKNDIKRDANEKKPVLENIIYRDLPIKNIKSKSNHSPLSHGDTSGLDKRLARRLKRGKMQIDARLDLHGYHKDEALQILSNFIIRAAESKKRCVLVITGKGLHYEKSGNQKVGVLRKMVPIWLNEEPNRSLILSFSHATPSDGGVGALYILLKRRRAGAFA